jgi:hypothetical protein
MAALARSLSQSVRRTINIDELRESFTDAMTAIFANNPVGQFCAHQGRSCCSAEQIDIVISINGI